MVPYTKFQYIVLGFVEIIEMNLVIKIHFIKENIGIR